ncbi:outer membrane protein assembly factor BamD [Vallitalea okinawensis]|uniref:hypothetical protein n=1 Tax=Vallitalea okinawensis TaxID=2078660 RepID=UPI000CFDB8D4|nr:hypothetical protein [Vallitalea okinawensis]
MKRNIFIMIAILTLCLSITACGNAENIVKKIDADDFTISYGKSIYQAKDKLEQKNIDILIENYNKITLDGTTNQEINYDNAITIIFINNDQISGQVTIDDKGICRIDDNIDNYIINKENDIYEDLLKVYLDLKEKYE